LLLALIVCPDWLLRCRLHLFLRHRLLLIPKLAKKSEFDVPANVGWTKMETWFGYDWVVIGSFFLEKPRIFDNNGQTKFSLLPHFFPTKLFDDWTP
jgi:hypothetical protein